MSPPKFSSSIVTGLAGLALTLGLLWWLQSILVPIALAVLLTFLLSPPVFWLQRHGVPRVLAVVAMIVGSLAVGGSIAWTVAVQLNRLVDTFPDYQQHLDAKIALVRSDGRGFFDKVQAIVGRVSTQLEKAASSRAMNRRGPPDSRPQPVVIVDGGGPFNLGGVWKAVNPLLEPLATGGLTLVLVIFMMLRREDLRDRVIAVVGRARLVATTKAFDDAGTRISRYLVRQLMVNSAFGVALGSGLFLIGVPYAILWGALAAVLRYVPYLGIWLASIVPLALSLVLTDGWQPVLMVVGLFLALELAVNMFIEPRFYGQGVGVSETGTLVMVTFWTWLWGPAGLLLATPLTVCVVVMGKYVPALRPFSMLLGDRPALAPEVRFYQRMLAGDEHESFEIVRQAIAGGAALPSSLDTLVRPALGYLRRDMAYGQLTQAEEQLALGLCERVAERLLPDEAAHKPPVPAQAPAQSPQRPVLLVSTRDAASACAVKIFGRTLDRQRHEVLLVPAGQLASELTAQVSAARPAAAVIGVVSAESLSHARLLCVRLRAADPELSIIVGHWALRTQSGDEDTSGRERLLAAGADLVVDSFDEVRAHLDGLSRPMAGDGEH